jgi:probable HAF family extracellular repeat protein
MFMMVRTVAIVASFMTVLSTGTVEATPYTFIKIQVPGATQTIALGINKYGDITGYSFGSTGLHGFLYEAGRSRTLDFPGAWETIPAGINDSGQIVGGVTLEPFGQAHGFFYDGATFTVLDVSGARNGVAFGINNYGDIVGTYVDTAQHGFLLRDGEFVPVDMPVPGTFLTRANGINDRDQIVGEYNDMPSSSRQHGFLLSRGRYRSLDVPGAQGTSATGINKNGEVVGFFYTETGPSTPFVYVEGEFTTLVVPGAVWAVATGINNRGQVIGIYDDGESISSFLATLVSKKK